MGDVKILVFQGLPRESKTFRASKELELVNTAIFISARHEIVEQAFNRFSCPRGKTAVKMEGKSRLCKMDTPNCSTCRMKPDETDPNHIGFFQLNSLVESMMGSHQKCSRKTVESIETDEIRKLHGGICPYYALKVAMESCNYVFTVPQIEIPKKCAVDLLVIDEDPSLQHYFPQSMEICSFTHLPNNSSVQIGIPDFQFLIDEIEGKPQRHVDRDILKAISTLDALRAVLVSFKDNKIDDDKIVETLDNILLPVFEDRDAAYKEISKRLTGDGRRVCFDPVFYPAPIRFYLETSRVKNTIFAIADSEHQVRNFPPSKRMLLIGATMAEKIAKIHAPDACMVREFKSFHYAHNFAIIPVQATTTISINGTEYERGSRDKTQKFMLTIADTLTQNNTPCIVVVGSEQMQRKVEADLREMGVPPLVCQQETRDELDDNLLTGRPTILYANSSVSRGIDLDCFDVILLIHADYSTPYWSAMESYWKDKDEEKSREYHNIREQILIDETVNLAFRIAPVKGVWEDYPKILFIPEYYLERIEARCEDLHIAEKLDSAISKHIITPKNIDITNLGADIRAQFRSVVKIREKGEKAPETGSDSSENMKISDISNHFPDLVPNAPILDAVREGRLVEFVIGFVLNDTGRSVSFDPVSAYLERLIRSLVIECIRTHSTADKNGVSAVSTNDIIEFVQNPSKEWITNNPDVVMPDTRNERGRPQIYLATRDQVRKVLMRMKADGSLKHTRKGHKNMWSLTDRAVMDTDTDVKNTVTTVPNRKDTISGIALISVVDGVSVICSGTIKVSVVNGCDSEV